MPEEKKDQAEFEEKMSKVYDRLIEADTEHNIGWNGKHRHFPPSGGNGERYISREELHNYLEKKLDSASLPKGVTIKELSEEIFSTLDNRYVFADGIVITSDSNRWKDDRVRGGVDNIENVLEKPENQQLLKFLADLNPADIPANGSFKEAPAVNQPNNDSVKNQR